MVTGTLAEESEKLGSDPNLGVEWAGVQEISGVPKIVIVSKL